MAALHLGAWQDVEAASAAQRSVRAGMHGHEARTETGGWRRAIEWAWHAQRGTDTRRHAHADTRTCAHGDGRVHMNGRSRGGALHVKSLCNGRRTSRRWQHGIAVHGRTARRPARRSALCGRACRGTRHARRLAAGDVRLNGHGMHEEAQRRAGMRTETHGRARTAWVGVHMNGRTRGGALHGIRII